MCAASASDRPSRAPASDASSPDADAPDADVPDADAPDADAHPRSFALDFPAEDDLRFAPLDPQRVNLLGVSSQWVRVTALDDLADHLPPEMGADALAHLARCRATGAPVAYETRLDARFDDPRGTAWWLTQMTPLHDADGTVWRIVGTATPITARKRLEARLAERERRLRLLYTVTARRDESVDAQMQHLVERIADVLTMDTGMIGRLDDAGRYAVEAATGAPYGPGAVVDAEDVYCDLVLDARRLVAVQDVTASPYHDPRCYHLLGLRSFIGAPLYVNGALWGALTFAGAAPRPAPFTDDDRTFLRLVVQWVEAALEARARQRRLHETQRLLKASQRIARMGGWTRDLRTGAVRWTREMYTIHGVDPATYTPTLDAVRDFIDDEGERQRVLDAFGAAEATGAPVELELRIVTGAGRTRWVVTRGQVEHDADGAPVRAWGTVQDVTERKRRELELRRAKEAAEEAERLKAAFLANVSHEIRTPLTSVIGFAEVLEEEIDGPHQRMAGLIGRSGRRLLDTINSVLALSRLEAGMAENIEEPVDAAAVAREAADLLRLRARENDLTLEADVPDRAVCCLGHYASVHRILLNLLSNAVKFTPAGGTVALRVTQDDARVHLVVRDTGIGMSPGFRERLFQPFTQDTDGHPHARTHEGSGLGLAITKRLVDQMEGAIDVESAPGEGTRIHVTLPRYTGA